MTVLCIVLRNIPTIIHTKSEVILTWDNKATFLSDSSAAQVIPWYILPLTSLQKQTKFCVSGLIHHLVRSISQTSKYQSTVKQVSPNVKTNIVMYLLTNLLNSSLITSGLSKLVLNWTKVSLFWSTNFCCIETGTQVYVKLIEYGINTAVIFNSTV